MADPGRGGAIFGLYLEGYLRVELRLASMKILPHRNGLSSHHAIYRFKEKGP